VTASDRILADCEAIIKAVDKAVPQIYIEARFIELSNEAMHKLGVQWDQLESWGATVHSLNGGMAYNNGRINKHDIGTTMTTVKAADGSEKLVPTANTLVPGKVDDIANPARLRGSQDHNSYHDQAVERDADMVWRNARIFSGQLSADDFRLAMSAFEEMEDTKIFSNPKIIVSNGKEALSTVRRSSPTSRSRRSTTRSPATLRATPSWKSYQARTVSSPRRLSSPGASRFP
jgi:type II secretory pathway component GspD/PulD (secretin)